MTAIVVLARAAIRRRWRSILGISLLVGLAGTAVLAATAGARRTATALDRFTQYSRSADVELTVGNASVAQLRAFERTDGVAAMAGLRQISLVQGDQFLTAAAALDGRFGTAVDRPRVVTGRLPKVSEPDDLAIGEALADQLRLRVGDHLTVESYSRAQVVQASSDVNVGPPAGPRVRLRVVGIVRRPLDLGARGAAGGVVVPTPAFLEKYPDVGSFAGTILRVRTSNGAADVPHVVASARRIFGAAPEFDVQGLGIETEGARNAIAVLTVALWLFAGIAALASVVAVGIVVDREVGGAAGDQRVVGALGATRRQRAAATGAVAMPIAFGGAAFAVFGASLASALLPAGVARKAEPDPGVRLDWLVLGLGLVAVVAFVLAIATFAAARLTRASAPNAARASDTARPSVVARAAAGAGLAPPATTGLRLALEPGRGPTAVPVRSALFGAAFGVLGVVGVLTFASSLDRLVTTPRLYGWSWDVVIPDDAARARKGEPCAVDTGLRRDPALTALSAVCIVNVEVDGRPIAGWSFTSLRGRIQPAVVAGRLPRGGTEVALGASTLDALDKGVGDTVRIRRGARTARFRVVGRIVLPTVSDPQPLADGAVFPAAGLSRLGSSAADDNTDVQLVAQFAPGIDIAKVTRQFNERTRFPGERVLGPHLPVEIDRLRQVDQLPAILGGFLGLLAAVAVGHALVTAVRRRRRDLAILKTLGFERGQVRATVAWQATALSAVGLVSGIPVGLAAGAIAWHLVADGLGVSTSTTAPVAGLLVIVPAGIALANVIAAVPARSAARTRPAVVLRSE